MASEKAPNEKPQKKNSEKPKAPAGGFDSTPVPHAPPGYTVKITFHRADNLPMADINSLSSDPYVLAQINTSLPSRHKEDPHLRMRTKTIHRCTEPVWECEWIVANIPASGFKLKARIYDEDSADHDDRLGNVHVPVGQIDQKWPGIKNQAYSIKKRMGSKRAYFVRAVASCFDKNTRMSGHLYVSVEVLGRTEGNEGGRVYTVGPCWWTKHYSPLLGRITGKKDTGDYEQDKSKRKTQQYNFQANQFQLRGPVPADLYHRYVEFKPFVKEMFTSKGIGGFLLYKALHHQHARVYNFDRSTEYAVFQEPCEDMTLKFLDLVHWDRGGRIFTYVLTLDSLFRFTETGKEFGIDMLSKHTMHSDVSIYVAFSGEFFIRRLKYPNRDPPEEGGDNPTSPPDDIKGGPSDEMLHKNPRYFELVIDNDSGTYRPNAKLLPQLRALMEKNFPGLHVTTLDSQGDAERMAEMKQEQRDRKKKEGDHIVYKQLLRNSSISSSDEEDLDRLEEAGEPSDSHVVKQVKNQIAYKYDKNKEKITTYKSGHSREDEGRVVDEKAGGSGANEGESGANEGESGAKKENEKPVKGR